MKPKQQKLLFIIFSIVFLACLVFQSGCKSAGIIAAMGTPTRYEKKVPAEYKLAEDIKQKILVLVDQPSWLEASSNLRFYLTDITNKYLIEHVKIPAENIIGYDELSKFRSACPDFSQLSAAKVGDALKADKVLFITLADFQVSEIAESGYYEGLLSAQAIIFESSSGKKLWPKMSDGKRIKVGFDVEHRGREAAVMRLLVACAHCTVRYLYDCPLPNYRIGDDLRRVGWKDWDLE